MIDVISVYNDTARDNISESENGYFSYDMFNRVSRRAETRLLDYLTGDTEGLKPPMMQGNQKGRDWLSCVVKRVDLQVQEGLVDVPTDYYINDNLYLLGDYNKEAACDGQPNSEGSNTPIELLNAQQFFTRCNTWIEELKPSFLKPIAKRVGNVFEFRPLDLGNIAIEYVSYPKFAKIVSKVDTDYDDVIADETKSTNYIWDEGMRELLVWMITDTFAIHSREQALKQQNSITGKSVMDIK